jgi:hypothetical protein
MLHVFSMLQNPGCAWSYKVFDWQGKWTECNCTKAAFPHVQQISLRHAITQQDGQTIRWKHASAAGKRQIHARISRSKSGRHALPCVYPLSTHFARASPLAYCCPYTWNQRMCHCMHSCTSGNAAKMSVYLVESKHTWHVPAVMMFTSTVEASY